MPSIRPAGGWSINPAVRPDLPNEPEAISRVPNGHHGIPSTLRRCGSACSDCSAKIARMPRIADPGLDVVPHARDSGWRASEPAHRLQELRSEAVFQGRPGMPDRGNVSQPERLWREQGSVKSAVPAKDRPGNQPALTGSRTC